MPERTDERTREENWKKSDHARAEMEKARVILESDESGNGDWFHHTYHNCHVAWTWKDGEFDARVRLVFVFDADKVVAVAEAIKEALG